MTYTKTQAILDILNSGEEVIAKSNLDADFVKAVADQNGIEIFETIQRVPDVEYVLWAV